MSLRPECFRNLQRIYFLVFPPGHFIAGLMQLPVMATA
jgi:hypothetical protein